MPKIKKCVECGGRTNNPDKKGRCPFCSKKKQDWKDCICGMMNSHTLECRKNHRKNYVHYHSTVINKRLRKDRKAKNLCAGCGKKAEKIICPHCKKIIGYKYRCKNCNNKINEYMERRKNEKVSKL